MAMNWGYNKGSSQPCARSSRCSTPAWPVTSKASWNPGTQGNCPRSFGRGGFLKSLAMRERPWEWSLTSREKFHVPELFSSCAAISFLMENKTISPGALNYILLYAKPLFMSGSVKWGIQFRIAPARHYLSAIFEVTYWRKMGYCTRYLTDPCAINIIRHILKEHLRANQYLRWGK